MSSLPPSAHNDAAKPRFDAEPELVNAAIAASARTRRIMFFSQVFGLVVLVVFFNTQFPRWARDRRRIVSAAQVLFRCAAPDRDVVYDSSPPPAAASAAPTTAAIALAASASLDSPSACVSASAVAPAAGSAGSATPSASAPSHTRILRPRFPDTSQETGLSGWDTSSAIDPKVKERWRRQAIAWATSCENDGQIVAAGLTRVPLEQAALWVLVTNRSTADVDKELERLDGFERDNAYSLPVPLTGLRIDVNDFGLLGGAIHLSILLWLLVSIFREHQSLWAVKDPEARRASVAHNFFGNLSDDDASALPSSAALAGVDLRSRAGVYQICLALTAAMAVVPALFYGCGAGEVKLVLLAPSILALVTLLIAAVAAAETPRKRAKSMLSALAELAGLMTIALPLMAFSLLARADRDDATTFERFFPNLKELMFYHKLFFVINGVVTGAILALFIFLRWPRKTESGSWRASARRVRHRRRSSRRSPFTLAARVRPHRVRRSRLPLVECRR